MFKKYETGIGVSVDGPPELNIMRGPRDQKRNFQYQDQLVQNMKTLREEKIGFGTITLLSKANGTPDKIDTLLDWAIKNKINGRFNAMFRPNHRDPAWADKWCLNADELTYAYKRMFDTMMENSIEHTLKWNPITDFIKNLLGTGNLGSCTVNRCDYTTTTCKTIMPDGNLARCDRCFQDGYYYRGNTKSFVRSDMLKQTECVDCRYFEICGGGCPATGANGDWRHKTEFCSTYYELYKYIEKVLRGIHPGRKLSIDIPDFYNKHKNGFRMGQPDNKNAKNTEKPKNIQPGQHGDWENHGDSAC